VRRSSAFSSLPRLLRVPRGGEKGRPLPSFATGMQDKYCEKKGEIVGSVEVATYRRVLGGRKKAVGEGGGWRVENGAFNSTLVNLIAGFSEKEGGEGGSSKARAKGIEGETEKKKISPPSHLSHNHTIIRKMISLRGGKKGGPRGERKGWAL